MYEISVEITTNHEDVLIVPLPRDSTQHELSGICRNIERPFQHEIINVETEHLPPYGNRVLIFKALPGTQQATFRVPSHPSRPNIDPSSCLANGEAFTRRKRGGTIQQLSQRMPEDLSMFVGRTAALIKRWVPYSFPRERYSHTDDILPAFARTKFASRLPSRLLQRQTLGQDCLGMHALLCSILRTSDIPAVLDFGFRLNGQDSPHTWLWYWDRQCATWSMIDLNDSDFPMQGQTLTPRVSMSLGTSHDVSEIIEVAGTTVDYLQYFMSRRKLQGIDTEYKASFSSLWLS